MKESNTGVVGGIVVALIHKGMFDKLETQDEKRAEVVKTIAEVGKALD